MFLADTLSKAHLTVVRPTPQEEFEQVNITQYGTMTTQDQRCDRIRRGPETCDDEKHDLPISVMPFFSF